MQKHQQLSKQVPKLISYLIKNCSELFGANTLTLFEAYQNIVNENKENEMKENKDSGAEESDSLNSLHELNNNLSNRKPSNDLNVKSITDDHLHYSSTQSPLNTYSSYNSSTTSTPKFYQQTTSDKVSTNVNNCLLVNSTASSSASISSSTNNNTNKINQNNHRLSQTTNSVHQSYYAPMFSQQTPYTVNKVSLSNLSRDSGLTLSDTQLYSPEEDEEDLSDYHHIINQHLHLSKKLDSIASEKCNLSNKNQFKINNTNKITNNSTSLKKKCNNTKINRLNMTSSEEDDLHDDIEEVDIDELSEKSCASDNCAPLYSRIYNKHSNASDHHLLTKSAPHLANIDTISQSTTKQINDKVSNQTNSYHNQNKVNCTTIPLYLNSIKNNSISTDSATNSSCNSPSTASNISSTSLNLSSSNEYSASELQRNYFSSTSPEHVVHLASTPIGANNSDLFKITPKQPHIVTISAKGNSLQINPSLTKNKSTNVCNVSLNNKDPLNSSNQMNSKSNTNLIIKPYTTASQLLTPTNQINNMTKSNTLPIKINQQAPPSYQETMNRKEINARMANLIQSNTSRKISDSEIDNLISKKIYEQSLRVYNADTQKNLTLRAVPVQVKNQSDSDSDLDQYSKRKTNDTNTLKMTNKPIDQIDGIRLGNYSSVSVKVKPIVQQRCAKDQTEYWKKDINLSVATLRNKFTELCKQNECSTLNRKNSTNRINTDSKNNCKSISSIYDLCKSETKLDRNPVTNKPPINKLRSSYFSQNNLDNKNCVTIIQVIHGDDKLNQTRSNDSLSGEESYV